MFCAVSLFGLLFSGCATTARSSALPVPPGFDRVFGPSEEALVTAINITLSIDDPQIINQQLVNIAEVYINRGELANASLLLEQLLNVMNSNPRYTHGELLPDSSEITNHLLAPVTGSPLTVETLVQAAHQFWQLQEGGNAVQALNQALYELRLVPDGQQRAQLLRSYVDRALEIGDLTYEQVNDAVQQLIIYADRTTRIELLLYYSQRFIDRGLLTIAEDLVQHALVATFGAKEGWPMNYATLLFRRFINSVEVEEILSSQAFSQLPVVQLSNEEPSVHLAPRLATLLIVEAPAQLDTFLNTISDPHLKIQTLLAALESQPGRSRALGLLSDAEEIINNEPALPSRAEFAHQIALIALLYDANQIANPLLALSERLPAPISVRLRRRVALTERYHELNATDAALRSYRASRRYRDISALSPKLQQAWSRQIMRYDSINELLSDLLTINDAQPVVNVLLVIDERQTTPFGPLQQDILRRIRRRFE